ncbi:MAG: ribonuclease P protein component [Elusimicrobiota bacterium]
MSQEKSVLKYTLRYSEKLHSQKDFQQIIRSGRRLVHPALLIYAGNNGLPAGTRRLGLITSRKIGIAVRRNRLKRRFREIFRLNKYLIKLNTDLIFAPKPPAGDMNYAQLESIILNLLEKAGLLYKVNGKS